MRSEGEVSPVFPPMKLPCAAKRFPTRTTLGLLALAALTGQSYGQVLKLGVSFSGRNSGALDFGIDAIAGVDPQQDWNILQAPFNFPDGGGAGPFTTAPLLIDNGVNGTSGTSTITATVTANDSWSSDGPTGTPDEQLMKGIIKAAFAPTPKVGTVTINGLLTGASYKVIAYSAMNGTGSTSDWSIAGATAYDTYFITSENSFDGTFTRGLSLSAAARSAEVDYVQWDSVVPSATGTLTLNWTWQGGADGAGLAGFQLVQLATPVDRTWDRGAGAGVWDNTSVNWVDVAETPGVFLDFDRAIFSNRGTTGARTITVAAGGVTTSDFTVANTAANPYTIGGGGAIRGPGKLIKSGVGELTMVGENEFTGGVEVRHGTLNTATIGDSTTLGALGRAGTIGLGDPNPGGANDAVLNYTGVTATAVRNVATLGVNGGTFTIPAGVTLTLNDLSGTSPLTKGGAGTLAFTGGTGQFGGSITVPQGGLSLARIGSGTDKVMTLGTTGAATFSYSGPSVRDARTLTVGTSGATITVSNANALYLMKSATTTTGALTINGPGRFGFTDAVNFTAMPTIAPGATLALRGETGNTLPAGALTVTTGTLEIAAPTTAGEATPLILAGGTLRLGHEGLQGQYYTGGLGDIVNDMSGTSRNISSYFAPLTADVTARTNTNGRVDLNFSNAFGPLAPFADQGVTAENDVRAYFTGKILITQAGQHTFFTRSDDGSAIYIDGQRVVSNNAFQGQTERTGTIDLTPGLHDIQIFYYEGGGDAGLNVEYIPVGGARQVIPNSVLFAGDVYASATTPVNVTTSSTLEVAAGRADLGVLTQSPATTLTVSGSANFSGSSLAAGNYNLVTSSRLGVVNLGAITGAGARTITKTGPGALAFSQTTPPAGVTVNVNEGLIVNLGSDTLDALAGLTVNYGANGGLGLDSTAGNPTYTNPIAVSENFRLEAGGFGGQTTDTTITYSPSNGINIAAGKTLTVATNVRNYGLTITPAVQGSGAVVVEQGRVTFSGPTFAASGGLTVHTGQVAVTGPVTAGDISLTNNLNGVSPTGAALRGSLDLQGTVGAAAVTVGGGVLSVGGALTASGPYTQSAGTATFNGTVNVASLAMTGGTMTSQGAVISAGAVTFAGNANATVNANVTAASLALSGASNVTVTGNLTAPGGTVVNSGSTLTLGGASGATANGLTLNGGTIRATGGVTDLGTNSLVATPRTFTPGLLEGFFANTGINAAAPNTGTGRPNSDTGGVRLSPRMGLTAQKDAVNPGNYWGENESWVYTGQFFDADGIFTFGENIDDQTRVIIDGVTVLSNDQWNVATNTQGPDGTQHDTGATVPSANSGAIKADNNYGMGPLGDGWHTFEVRFQGGGGGNGPINFQGWGGGDNASYTNKGFGLAPNGTTSRLGGDYILPIDPGDGSLFRVQAQGTGGIISIDAGATIAAASTTGAQLITMTGFTGFSSTLKLNNNATATASNADDLQLTGFAPAGALDIGTNNTFTVGRINLVDDAELVKKGVGTVVVSGAVTGTSGIATSNFATGTFRVEAGHLIFNGASSGTGRVLVRDTGRLSGIGSIPKLTAQTGGLVTPGNEGAGQLTVGSTTEAGQLELLSGGTLTMELQSKTVLDQLRVFGGVTLDSATLQLSALPGLQTQIADLLFLIINDGVDPILNLAGTGPGTFAGLPNNTTVTVGGLPFQISYFGDSTTNSAVGGNDVVLIAGVPEPGTVSALLGGMATLLGLQRFRRRSK
jgi:autotransporter-associated beta strand protein